MLKEITLTGEVDKVEVAMARLRLHEPKEGYYVAFSGGKDSCVILDLCRRAGVKYDAHYHLTTVEPPELIYFVRKNYPDVLIERPNYTMWQLIEKNMYPPTRLARYCCKELKEVGGDGRNVVTGIRAEESARRKQRQLFEPCRNSRGKFFIHPIMEWSKEDVWEYIRTYNIPYCSLYDEGFERIGCIMCPFHTPKQLKKDMDRWPKICKNYEKAFQRAYDKRIKEGNGVRQWKSGKDIFEWWINPYHKEKENPDQISIFGVLDDEGIT